MYVVIPYRNRCGLFICLNSRRTFRLFSGRAYAAIFYQKGIVYNRIMRKILFYRQIIICGVMFAPLLFVFAQSADFTVTLRRGSIGEDVRRLQEFLKRDPAIYPDGLVTGYFGALTESAVKRFQKTYGILQIGIVGPQTRKKLNELVRSLSPLSVIPASSEIRREISIPTPLRVVRPASASAVILTPLGVLEETNRERIQNNLPALEKNIALDWAASAKLQDMFLRQYFAHESPTGKRASDLAKDAGYEFVNIGENLALGDFESDEALVQAWMNSPGHRANILGARYKEIGIAVAKSVFEGRSTWLAVQIFAKPLAVCPALDTELRASIEEKKKRIDDLSALVGIKKGELDAIPQSEIERYNEKVEDYNAVVSELNMFVEEVKMMVEKYNGQVGAFNACVAAPVS